MSKYMRIVEIMWLVIAAISVFEVFRRVSSGIPWDDKGYIFVGAIFVSIFMYFFRRKQRLNYQARQQSK